MTTTPEATKGVPRHEGNSTFTPRADHNALADWVRDNVAPSVATAAALPVTGNWIGKIVAVEEYDLVYQCVSLPGSWRVLNPGGVRALVTAQRVSFSALGKNDLAVVEDTLSMVNAATDEITVPVSGTYRVTFNFVQSGTTACLGAIFINGVQKVTAGAVGATGAPATPSATADLVLLAGDVVTFQSSAAATMTFQSTSTASVVLVAG